jgi:hypothetical protein
MKNLLIIIVIAVVAWYAWTHYHHTTTDTAATAGTSASQSCVSAASAASDAWGSGIGHFANPPYDTGAWDDFRNRVETQARRAEENCLCGDAACSKAKSAMSDLRSLIAEMDTSLRSGSPPPSDLVQRQEAIDNAINSARDAAK